MQTRKTILQRSNAWGRKGWFYPSGKIAHFFFQAVFFFPPFEIEWKWWSEIPKKKGPQNFISRFSLKKKGPHFQVFMIRQKKKGPKFFYSHYENPVYFFFRFAEKKKTQHFGIWMNEWPTNFIREKKNTIPLFLLNFFFFLKLRRFFVFFPLKEKKYNTLWVR